MYQLHTYRNRRYLHVNGESAENIEQRTAENEEHSSRTMQTVKLNIVDSPILHAGFYYYRNI